MKTLIRKVLGVIEKGNFYGHSIAQSEKKTANMIFLVKTIFLFSTQFSSGFVSGRRRSQYPPVNKGYWRLVMHQYGNDITGTKQLCPQFWGLLFGIILAISNVVADDFERDITGQFKAGDTVDVTLKENEKITLRISSMTDKILHGVSIRGVNVDYEINLSEVIKIEKHGKFIYTLSTNTPFVVAIIVIGTVSLLFYFNHMMFENNWP